MVKSMHKYNANTENGEREMQVMKSEQRIRKPLVENPTGKCRLSVFGLHGYLRFLHISKNEFEFTNIPYLKSPSALFQQFPFSLISIVLACQLLIFDTYTNTIECLVSFAYNILMKFHHIVFFIFLWLPSSMFSPYATYFIGNHKLLEIGDRLKFELSALYDYYHIKKLFIKVNPE